MQSSFAIANFLKACCDIFLGWARLRSLQGPHETFTCASQSTRAVSSWLSSFLRPSTCSCRCTTSPAWAMAACLWASASQCKANCWAFFVCACSWDLTSVIAFSMSKMWPAFSSSYFCCNAVYSAYRKKLVLAMLYTLSIYGSAFQKILKRRQEQCPWCLTIVAKWTLCFRSISKPWNNENSRRCLLFTWQISSLCKQDLAETITRCLDRSQENDYDMQS